MTTPLELARLYTADTDPDNQLLTDDQYTTLLAANRGHPRRAAADALDIIATSEALISKKITATDISTDGPAVARELRERAAALRQQADDEPDPADPYAGIHIVDFDPSRWW